MNMFFIVLNKKKRISFYEYELFFTNPANLQFMTFLCVCVGYKVNLYLNVNAYKNMELCIGDELRVGIKCKNTTW